MPRLIFFCAGPPKSGTTYLQRLLDRHPEVACAPEQDFHRLGELLTEAVQQYNRHAALFDRRTGGTGRAAFDKRQERQLLRSAILLLMRGRAPGKTVVGAKDNQVFQRSEGFARFFPGARFLYILRNPLDRAVSAWHHNRRLAESEKNPLHLELVARHGSLEGWVAHICRVMDAEWERLRAAKLPRERLLLLRYEDLVLRPLPELERILAFLGVDRSEAVMAGMLKQSSLPALRAEAGDPAFFRSGATDAGRSEIPAAARQDLAGRYSGLFDDLGYRITESGLDLLPFPLR